MSQEYAGSEKVFVSISKAKINHELMTFDCIIYQEVLCAQTSPKELGHVIDSAIKIVNKIVVKKLHHRRL